MRAFFFPAVVITVWISLASPLLAQDDPFDFPSGIFDTANELPAAEASDAGDENAEQAEIEPLPPTPVVTQLLEHAARGNRELAIAIGSLARLGRWQEVDQLLVSAAGRGLSESDKAAMARQIGPALIVRIALNSTLSDQARSAIGEFAKAAKTDSESPDRLRAAIDRLDAPSVDDRLATARLLLAGGNATIAELVSALVSENPSAPRTKLLGMLAEFGEGGTEALQRLALYGAPDVRRRAIESLAVLEPQAAFFDLITALHAPDATAEEVEFAQNRLQRSFERMPSLETTMSLLRRELRRLRQVAQQTPNDEQVAVAWTVDPATGGVTSQPTPAVMLAYRDASDMAARMRRIGKMSLEDSRLALTADLAYRLMVDPDWGDPTQKQEVRSAYPETARGDGLAPAIAEALKTQDQSALVGLIRLVDEDLPMIDRLAYLRGSSAAPTPLVQAASAANPRVRYEAAAKASRLAGSTPYSGSSRIRQTLGEMTTLGALPTAILVETRNDVIVRQQNNLQQLGFDVDVVGSVGQLQRRLARGGDLRMILSKTDLADQSAIELVDVVRRTDRGREVPIVLYGSPVIGVESARWSAPLQQIDQPLSPLSFAEMMQRIEASRSLPPLSAVDRRLYAEEAGEILATDR